MEDNDVLENALQYQHDVGFDEGYQVGYEDGYNDAKEEADGELQPREHINPSGC